jgi:hypothetical protein
MRSRQGRIHFQILHHLQLTARTRFRILRLLPPTAQVLRHICNIAVTQHNLNKLVNPANLRMYQLPMYQLKYRHQTTKLLLLGMPYKHQPLRYQPQPRNQQPLPPHFHPHFTQLPKPKLTPNPKLTRNTLFISNILPKPRPLPR